MYSKELLKGTLKPILLKLLRERKRMYGYEMVQEVREMSAGKIVIKEGSLYPLLHSMKAEGILDTESVKLGKRVRKYYSLTQKGKTVAETVLSELTDFLQTVETIIKSKPKTAYGTG